MTRNELIAKIEAYVKHKGWNKTQFAVDGQAAKFLLGDCIEFIPPIVQLSLSQTNCHRVGDEEFQGLRFVATVNQPGWATVHPLVETNHFVASARHRLDKRRGNDQTTESSDEIKNKSAP